MIAVRPVYLIAGAAVGVALLWAMRQGSAAKLGESIGGAAVDLADGLVSGTVTTIGQAVGIPKTEVNRCEAAKAANNLWEVSRYCGVIDYFKQIPTSVGAIFD